MNIIEVNQIISIEDVIADRFKNINEASAEDKLAMLLDLYVNENEIIFYRRFE